MTAVHDTVQNGICQGRIIQIGMPGFDRQLAGDQGGLGPDPIIEHFKQVISLRRPLKWTPESGQT